MASCWALSIGLENDGSFPRPKVGYVIIPCRTCILYMMYIYITLYALIL